MAVPLLARRRCTEYTAIPLLLYRSHSRTQNANPDIWKFTLFWTFTIFGTVFLGAGLWAWSVYFFQTKWALLIPLIYVLFGEFIALISGTIVGSPPNEESDVGFTLAAVYNAGFKMSTWIPFFWGLIQILTVVSAGYSTVSSIL
jgi:Putative transmembrane protein 170